MLYRRMHETSHPAPKSPAQVRHKERSVKKRQTRISGLQLGFRAQGSASLSFYALRFSCAFGMPASGFRAWTFILGPLNPQ